MAGEGTNYVVMPAAEFDRASQIIGMEMYAETAGNVDVYVRALNFLHQTQW